MVVTDILERLGKDTISADDLVEEIKQDENLIPVVIEGISSNNARIKFGCAKILRTISEEQPEILYQNIDYFIELLNHDNQIIKWNAMDIIANLTQVDKEKKFDEIFKRYYDHINENAMVTVGHVIDNSGKIALAKPYLAEKITNELLKIEKLPTKSRLTHECKNILYGKTILAFDTFIDQIKNKNEVVSFVRRQLKNSRNSTRSKAEKFLKKIEA
jgi:hypothetical protein